MNKKCFYCKKELVIPDEIRGLNLAPCTCHDCFVKKTGIFIPGYMTDQGMIKVISFKAVTQERAMRIVCSDCPEDVHTFDSVIFIFCEFKYPDGKVHKYEYGHIIPPQKYWCPTPKILRQRIK